MNVKAIIGEKLGMSQVFTEDGKAVPVTLVQAGPCVVAAGTTPGRVFRGMRGPGHMGHQRTTILSQEVVESDGERNLLLIKGAVPGPNGGLVIVRTAVKKGSA